MHFVAPLTISLSRGHAIFCTAHILCAWASHRFWILHSLDTMFPRLQFEDVCQLFMTLHISCHVADSCPAYNCCDTRPLQLCLIPRPLGAGAYLLLPPHHSCHTVHPTRKPRLCDGICLAPPWIFRDSFGRNFGYAADPMLSFDNVTTYVRAVSKSVCACMRACVCVCVCVRVHRCFESNAFD